MKITGSNVVPYPVEQVWDSLLDPRVLVATIPGCERLVALPTSSAGEHAYDMTVTAGVAAIKGTYEGSCTLTDLVEHQSLLMRLTGAGAPGTVDASVQVRFGEAESGQTVVDYEADAVVGGMVGGVGQRMLTSVSRRMAADFFGNVAATIGQGPVTEAAPVAAAGQPAPEHGMPTYYREAVPGRAPGGRDDFLRGIAVGAGLVLLGVVAGRLLGRR